MRLLVPGAGSQAQLPTATQAVDSARSDSAVVQRPISPASPRRSVEAYLTLARADRFGEAARYLDLGDSTGGRGVELARRLKSVLDHHLWVDLSELSPLSQGDTADGLAASVDQIGVIVSPQGVRQPVRIGRSVRDGEVQWRFTRGTVERVDDWYGALRGRWALDHLPAPLLRPGPFEILWWQWLILPVIVGVGAAAGHGASRLLLAIFGRVARRTASSWDDALLARLRGPAAFTAALMVTAAILPVLSLYPPAAATVSRTIRAGFFLVVFWTIWRLVDVGREVAGRSHWALSAPSSRALLPLAARTAKVVVLAVSVVAILSLLGYPVASLVAGLGLGGLALALAAQKTVENLFGAFSIGVDQPFREGDFVKIEEFVGTVERIGLRSTRFRTLDRTLITIPNGKLAEMRLESFTARDRLRFAAVIGLIYETTGAQVREVIAGFERTLLAHPKIWPDAVVVRFREFGASSLDIEVMAWFMTSDWGEFQGIRQDVLLDFMTVVETAGTAFAYPTQTVHLASHTVSTHEK